jgi:hypothetical protein
LFRLRRLFTDQPPSVIALSKLYELQDPRINSIQVKGDLIVPTNDNRIMTRSRAKLQPDQWTVAPANLKILKVLVEELHSAAGSGRELDREALEHLPEEGSDDEEEWEDDPDTLDLGLSATKSELIAFAEDSPYAFRQRDDGTQAYLLEFFRNASQKPDFGELFNSLTAEEQAKLRSFG